VKLTRNCWLHSIYHDCKAYKTVSVTATGGCPVWDETFALDFGQGRSANDPPPDGAFIVGVCGVKGGASSVALGHAKVLPMVATREAGEGVDEWNEFLGKMVGDSGGVWGTVQ
jgi:hypothetical protein